MNVSNKCCVCSGIRQCLLCQPNKLNKQKSDNYKDFYFCHICGHKAFTQELSQHSIHNNRTDLLLFEHYLTIEGVFLKKDVIDVNEESALLTKIDSIAWTDSQSGRRKQDFGPKVNFKKQKLNFTQFLGLPDFDIKLLQKIREQLSDGLLNDFIAVEVCHLDYNSVKGSSIDPHFDDFWLWGPRLVTVNLMSATVLNLVLPPESPPLSVREEHRIRVVLPQRSLLVLSAESRFKYYHSIDSKDIDGRRIAITFRELSEDFLPKGPQYEKWGKQVMERSLNALHF